MQGIDYERLRKHGSARAFLKSLPILVEALDTIPRPADKVVDVEAVALLAADCVRILLNREP